MLGLVSLGAIIAANVNHEHAAALRAAHDLAANTAAASENARAADKERAAEAAVAAAAALRAASRPHLLWRDADARLDLPVARPDADEAELHQVL